MPKIKVPECSNCGNACTILTNSKEPVANCPFCGDAVFMPFDDEDDDYEEEDSDDD